MDLWHYEIMIVTKIGGIIYKILSIFIYFNGNSTVNKIIVSLISNLNA